MDNINFNVDLMTVAVNGVEFSGIKMEFGEAPGFPARTLFMGNGVMPEWEDVFMTGKEVGDDLTLISFTSNGITVDVPESFKSCEEIDEWWEEMKRTLGV